jgi:hypothetical protein
MSSKEVTVKRNIPSAGLMIAVGACILYYLLVYIPANESRIKLRSVRQLNSFAENCIDAYEGYDEGVKAAHGKRKIVDPLLKRADKPHVVSNKGNGIAAWGDSICVYLTWDKAPRYMVSLEHLVHPLEDFREFDDIIVMDARDTLNYEVLDESRLKLTRYALHDSLLNRGVNIKQVELSAETYYAFHKRLKLGESQLAVVGFVSKTTFDRRARQVAPSVIIFFLLGFLMLLLSWPVLKLLLVNEHERLRNADIQMANYAVIFSAAFLTISIVGGYFFLASGPSQIENGLQTLSADIKKNFQRELHLRDSVLMVDTLFKPGQQFGKLDVPAFGTNGYHEIFSVDKHGDIKNLLMETKEKRYDSIFKAEGVKINVGTRPYFRQMMRLVVAGDRVRCFVQSIKSRTTGDQEFAISRFHKGNIRVLTSRLLSVMNPIPPPNYGFAIFDQDGIVQFHSDPRKVLTENLLEECGADLKLRSYMENATSGSINLHYGYDNYQMYMTPLTREWFLVTFYNKSHIGNLASSVVSFSLVSYAAILLYIFLLHIFFRLDKPKFRVLRSRAFFYQWLNPTLISGRKLRYIIVFLFAIVIIQTIWLFAGTSVVSSLLLLLLTTTVFYSVIYRILRNPAPSTSFEVMSFILAALWGLCLLFDRSNICVLIVIALFVVYIIAYIMASTFKDKTDDVVRSNGSYRLYRWFLMVSLLVLAISPSIILFKDHFQHERIIRARKTTTIQHLRLNPRTVTDDISYLKGLPYIYYNKGVRFIAQEFDNKNPGPYFSPTDAWFYNETISYFGDDAIDHLGLVAPDSGLWEMGHNDSTVFVRDHKAKHGKSDLWTSLPIPKFPLTLSAKRRAPLYIVMIILAAWALWQISFEVIRRVFYLPLFYNKRIEPKIPGSFSPAGKDVIYPLGPDIKEVPFEKRSGTLLDFEESVSGYGKENNLPVDHVSALGSRYDERSAQFEHTTLTIRAAFKSHFDNAWAELSDDEKYFLYDLAEDGIVNQYDKKMMHHMDEKGFIRMIPLEIRHPAIAEYIIEAVDRKAIAKMERKARTEGRWSSFRLPLAIIIIASLGFLSIVEEGLFSKISALLASVAFILPTLLNVFSSLPKLLPGKE